MRTILRSRARIFFVICLALAGYFTYTAANGVIRNQQLSDDRRAAEHEVATLEAKKAYLEAVKRYVASDAYVEQQARRQLGFARDGEVPFVVESPSLPDDSKPAGDWWQRLFPR
jgi:cell division protein FtsB